MYMTSLKYLAFLAPLHHYMCLLFYKFTIEHARMKQLNGKMHFKLPGLRVDVNKCHLNLNRIFNVCTTSQFQYFILL